MSGPSKALVGLFLGTVAVIVAPALAAPTVSMSITRSSDDATWGPQTPTGTSLGDNNYLYEGGSTNNGWNFDWDVIADADPFVNSALVVTNTASTTQTFISTVTLNISPSLAGATFRNGSIGIALTDNNGNNATLSTTGPGKAIYTAVVDGVDSHFLDSHPYSLVASPPGNSATSNTSFGVVGPLVPGGPALSTISIRLEFTLTPFDSAAITSRFEVVPEPASMSLLAVAGLGLLARRRRRA